MSQPIRGWGGHLVFSDRPEKHKHGRGRWDLASCQVSLNSVQRFLEKRSKMCQPIRDQGIHFVFPIGPKNTNLVEDVEILLLVKFRWIPFCGFREEVENVSANQRPGGRLNFPIGPKNTNLIKDVKILLPVKFRWIPFSGFREEVENVKVDDGRTTDDGQHVITIVDLSLRLRCTKNSDNTKTPQKMFDYIAIADRLRTITLSN